MNRKMVGMVFGIGIALAASTGAVRAQNSAAGAGIDTALRVAVERKDVPGVVALVTDRRRVLYQGAFGVAFGGSGSVGYGLEAAYHWISADPNAVTWVGVSAFLNFRMQQAS